MPQRRDGRPPLRRQDFGYVAEVSLPSAAPAPEARPVSEAEAEAAIRQALAAGPATFADLRRRCPQIHEAVLSRALGAMRTRGQVLLLGEGWALPSRWSLPGP